MRHANIATLAGLLGIVVFTGCATERVPQDALRLPESSVEIRALQTQRFEVPSADVILAATVSALQDLEYNIDVLQVPLGVITASKVADADNRLEKTGLFMMDLLCYLSLSGDCTATDTAQDNFVITMTMVVLPSLSNSDEYLVRITMQRALINKAGQIRNLERIDDPEIYQRLFSSLSKSLYIEENV